MNKTRQLTYAGSGAAAGWRSAESGPEDDRPSNRVYFYIQLQMMVNMFRIKITKFSE